MTFTSWRDGSMVKNACNTAEDLSPVPNIHQAAYNCLQF